MSKKLRNRAVHTSTVALLFAALLVSPSLSAAEGHGPQASPHRRAVADRSQGQRDDEMKSLARKARDGQRLETLWFGDDQTACYQGSGWGYLPALMTREYVAGTPDGAGTFYTYDHQGNQLMVENRNRAGDQFRRTECAYETDGDPHKSRVVTIKTSSSSPEFWPSYNVTYNAIGRRDVETLRYDFDQDGVFEGTEYKRYEYDASGYLTAQLWEEDYDSDGMIDYRLGAMASYDERHRLIRLVKGYNDGPGGSFLPYHTWWIEFHDAERYSVATEETDGDGDGVSDYTDQWAWYLDDAGRVVRETRAHDFWGGPYGIADGIFDSFADQHNEYDQRGNLIHVVFDRWGIDTLTFRDDYVYTYDKTGLVRTVYTTWTWFSPDFFVTEGSTTTYTNDSHGRVLEEVLVSESPWRTETDRTTNRYSGFGNLLETLRTRQIGNSEPEISSHYFYEYAAGRSSQVPGNR